MKSKNVQIFGIILLFIGIAITIHARKEISNYKVTVHWTPGDPGAEPPFEKDIFLDYPVSLKYTKIAGIGTSTAGATITFLIFVSSIVKTDV